MEYVAFAKHLSDALQDNAVGVEHQTFALQFNSAYHAFALCLSRHLTCEVKPSAVKAVRIFLSLTPGLPLANRLESSLVKVLPLDGLFGLDYFGAKLRDLFVYRTFKIPYVEYVT